MDTRQFPPQFHIISNWLTSPDRDTSFEVVDGLDVCVASTRGLRREENEDRACFARIAGDGQEPIYIALLCDGIGGMQAGAECANIAVSAILAVSAELINKRDLKEAFLFAIRQANAEIFRRHHGNGGTTLAAVLLYRNKCLSINVGDSRIYGVNSKNQVAQLSTDDTVATEVGQQLASISPSALDKLEFGEQLTQFIGIGSDLRLRETQWKSMELKEKIILLSDGAWRSSNGAFLKIIANAPNSAETGKRILHTKLL